MTPDERASLAAKGFDLGDECAPEEFAESTAYNGPLAERLYKSPTTRRGKEDRRHTGSGMSVCCGRPLSSEATCTLQQRLSLTASPVASSSTHALNPGSCCRRRPREAAPTQSPLAAATTVSPTNVLSTKIFSAVNPSSQAPHPARKLLAPLQPPHPQCFRTKRQPERRQPGVHRRPHKDPHHAHGPRIPLANRDRP